VRFDLRIGIDVGGTNTDAVLLDRDDRLLVATKQATTPDVSTGIGAAIDAVLAADGIDPGRVTHIMLGTTHATNAVIERRSLDRVAVLRIGSPSTDAIPPLCDWPEDLREAVCAAAAVTPGGIEFDGREIVPFDEAAVEAFLRPLAGLVHGVAITSVFASVSPRHELAAAAVARRVLGPDVRLSCSHEVGAVGLLERENATVLNTALHSVAVSVAGSLDLACRRHGIAPALFFAQNDGTLMALAEVLRLPVLTIGSGPSNSIRGAAYLSGRTDAIVADVGGTSTDVGVLVAGFPRESSAAVEIGGIRTNFRMPDLVAIAVGGGTVVTGDAGAVVVGPRSVGYRLSSEALVFGGDTATLTDAAVAGGRAAIGDRAPEPSLGPLLASALANADAMIADAVDRVKTARGDRPLIVVGGGSVLVPANLPGVSEVVRPPNHDVANAVGAAIAAVSGQVDRVYPLGAGGRDAALAEAEVQARAIAVRSGADAARLAVVAVDEVPLSYLQHPATRIRLKVAGPLAGS
jgi:N-methylhydantoinase A/oxoprolinase/acetone carboxylase beta subunit